MALDAAEIVSKSVEVSKSLVNTNPGMHTYDLSISREIGDLTRFAITIKGAQTIESAEQLAAFSTGMKIDFQLTHRTILPTLAGLDWLEVIKDGSKIRRVDERIPPIQDVITTLGKEWEEREPTDIDRGTIESLAKVSNRPYSMESLTGECSLKPEEFERLLDYGKQANYLGVFKSEEDGRDVIWTPLYWQGKAEEVERFLSKQSEPVYEKLSDIHKIVKKHQGIPTELIEDKSLINQGVHSGFFPAVSVNNRKGQKYDYTFTASPQFELDPQKDVFEKARMIVACIRNGQYHADGSSIKWPSLILAALREDRLSSHPNADVQYILLRQHNIIKLQPVDAWFGKGYRAEWIDTPENNIAADIAATMLRGQDPMVGSANEVEAQKILVQGMYSYSAELRKMTAGKEIAEKHGFQRMLEALRGVKR